MKQYTGKNIDDLLHSVATEKGVEVTQLYYEVVEEKGGFLGLGSKVTAEIYCDLDVIEFIKAYLERFFHGIGMEVSVSVTQVDKVFKVLLNADNNAILIGKNGQRLQAIIAVTRSATSAEFKKRINVFVDINGYKEEKYEKLSSMAVRIAKTVQRTKVDVVLDPMPNDERKAIHNYLTKMNHVRTVSEGEGNQRRIRIVYDQTKK
ncbi:MAG: protein jag [Erysipelotrichaceae bacterium]